MADGSWFVVLVSPGSCHWPNLLPADRAYFGIKSGIDDASMWKNNSDMWQMGPGSPVLVSPGCIGYAIPSSPAVEST